MFVLGEIERRVSACLVERNTLKETNVLDGVFNQFLQGACVFRDREILRHDYVPENLPHREEQIRFLGEIVAPVLKGERCSNILIYSK